MVACSWPAQILLWALLAFAPQDPKRPIPPAAAQKEAEKLVREVFKDEYAKTQTPDRLALARKLLKQAVETEDDMTARFVMLRDAREIAAAAGDADLAFRAISMLDGDFKIDALTLKHAALTAVGKSARGPDEIKSLSGYFLKLAAEAAGADEYDIAQQAMTSASTFARNAKDIPLATRSAARAKEMTDLKARFEKVKPARARLDSQPDDAASKGLVGYYLCAVKSDWAAGLPLLAKGDEAGVRSTAAKELAPASDPADQMSIGDFWWDRAEKEGGTVRENLRMRAAFWYERAAGGLSGLTKVKAEKRISEFFPGRPPGDWLDVADPKLWGTEGKFGEEFDLLARPGGSVVPPLIQWPPGKFDGIFARIRFGPNRKVQGALIFEGGARKVSIDGTANVVDAAHAGDGVWIQNVKAPCPSRDEYLLSVLLERTEYVVTVNGEEKLRVKTRATGFESLTLSAAEGTVTFDRMHLRRKK